MLIQRRALALFSSLAILCSSAAFAGDGETDGGSWPQWRGPSLNGLTAETDWTTEGKADNLWETELGLGYSSVTIENGRLYTMGFDKEAGLDVVWCLDAYTGDEIWAHAYPSKIWNEFHTGGTLTTPTIDGDSVYTLNREGSFFCLDAKTGDVRWEKNFTKEFDAKAGQWGFSASPLVLGDELIVNVGKVVSLDKKTGEVRWVSDEFGAAYSTPAAFEWNGKPALAVFNASIAIIEREKGTTITKREWKTDYDINAATPIVIDDAIFISSGYNHGSALLAMSDEGLEPVWESRAMRNHMSGCVLIDDHIFGFDDKVLKCIGLDGEVKWSERGTGEGALMGSPNRLIVMNGDGELVIAKATPAGYEELSKTKVFDSGVFWSKPVIVDGLIYCRNSEGVLVVRDHRAEK